MRTVTLRELEDRTSECHAAVEDGEQIEVHRAGRAEAESPSLDPIWSTVEGDGL